MAFSQHNSLKNGWPIQSPSKGRKNQSKFVDLRFEKTQVVGFGKGRRR